MNNKKYYKVKAIPFIFKEIKGGKAYKKYSLSDKETHEMSCQPRILWDRHDNVYDSTYFAELPLMYHENGPLTDSLYFIYDELNDEEKEKYKDKVIEVLVTIPGVVKIYHEEEKKIQKEEKKKKKRVRNKENPKK